MFGGTCIYTSTDIFWSFKHVPSEMNKAVYLHKQESSPHHSP